MIFITIFFFIISFIFKNHFLFILQILGIFTYVIQYSEYNYYFFCYYKNSIKLSIGYFCEIIPIAVTGLTLAKVNIIDSFKSIKKKSIFFFLIIIFILFRFDIFTNIKGFTYRGFLLNFGSSFLFITFSLLPINDIKSRFLLLIIRWISKYTQGIYSLHELIRDYLKIKFTMIQDKTIKGCIFIYLIAYFISFIGSKIFKKTKLENLFN